MIDITNLFASPAFAQDVSAATPSGLTPAMMNYLPLVVIIGIFYFIVIRPQQKKLEEQAKMIKALQRGDRIVTNSGIHGKITKIEGDDHLMVEIADGIHVKMERSHVQGLAAKTQPVAANQGEKKE